MLTGDHCWNYYPGTPTSRSSHCNSIEVRVSVHKIKMGGSDLILKTGYQDSSSSNVHHLCPANSDYCPLLTPEEGHMAIRYEHVAGVNGVTAIYGCVPGYDLQQGQTGRRTCNVLQSQGQWTGATPTCERELNTSYMEHHYIETGPWSSESAPFLLICRHSDDNQYLCKYITTYVKWPMKHYENIV